MTCASLQGLPKHQPPLLSPIFSHRFLSKSPLFSPGGCFCDVLLPCPGMWHPPAPIASKEGQGTGTWPRQGCSKGLSCFQKADFHEAKRIEHTSDEKKGFISSLCCFRSPPETHSQQSHHHQDPDLGLLQNQVPSRLLQITGVSAEIRPLF